MFFISQQILGTLDISDNISTSSFKGLGACDNSSLYIDGAFDLQFLSALSVEVQVVERGSHWSKLSLRRRDTVDGDGDCENSDCECCNLLHCRIIYDHKLIHHLRDPINH